MVKTLLTIRAGKSIRQAELNPKGVIIGRSPQCDIVLHSRHVSREHARIFQDPFGRWIIKDLGKNIQLLVFTDGIINAKSPSGEKFGMKQLEKLLKSADDRSAEGLRRLIVKAVEEFCHPYPLQDDITVFSLHT